MRTKHFSYNLYSRTVGATVVGGLWALSGRGTLLKQTSAAQES